MRTASYSPKEIALLSGTRQYYGRLLNTRTREYAIDNATCNISKVIRYFELNRDGAKSVIDIGCGLGMQSIIFAARGARVVGIDLNPHCIRLCNKRKRYYEELLQIDLDIEFKEMNFSTLDPATIHERYDCAFSKSAIAYMYPFERVVCNVESLLKCQAKVFIWDRNPEYLFRKLINPAHHEPGPVRMATEFTKHGFMVETLTGGCAVPWYFWQPRQLVPIAKLVNSVLKRRLSLAFTYVLAASRTERAK